MIFKKKKKAELFLSMHRLEGLIDGIFAIAMTILVLDLELPSVGEFHNSQDLLGKLKGLIPVFTNFVISFFILGNLWMNTTFQFHYIKQTNRKHMWRHLWFLLFIVLIPFTTSVMGDFVGFTIAEIIFHLNLLVVGIISFVTWNYIIKNQELIKAEHEDLIVLKKNRNGSRDTRPCVSTLFVYLDAICFGKITKDG